MPIDFKTGGDSDATAAAAQLNFDPTLLVNAGVDVGVGNLDILTDEDIVRQGQRVGAMAEGGAGGTDNVTQNINV